MNILGVFKNNKLLKNLSWILLGNIAHAILSFLLSVMAARYFSTSDYGVLSYALSLTTLFSSFCSLGLNVIITKEIADDEANSGNILSSGILLRLFAGMIALVFMFAFLLIKKSDPVSFKIISIYALGILFAAFDLFMYWFRYDYKSNVAAILKLVAFAISAIIKGVAIAKSSVIIFAIGAVTETLMYGFLLSTIYIKQKGNHLHPTFKRARKLFRMATPFIFSSILVAIYSQTDKLMLEAMSGYEAVAQYSVSLTIANVIGVALSSLVEAFRPEILKVRETNRSRYNKLYKELYGLTFWVSILYGITITVFNKQVLTILYGEKYLLAKNALSLIVWYSSFSYFGAIHNIYMVAENRAKWVQVLTLSGVVSNVILNYLMIPQMGAAGAALASLLTQVIANFILPLCIPQLRKMAVLTIQGVFSVPIIARLR